MNPPIWRIHVQVKYKFEYRIHIEFSKNSTPFNISILAKHRKYLWCGECKQINSERTCNNFKMSQLSVVTSPVVNVIVTSSVTSFASEKHFQKDLTVAVLKASCG